jgi:hypothetical protein
VSARIRLRGQAVASLVVLAGAAEYARAADKPAAAEFPAAGEAPESVEHRVSVGLQVGVLDRPTGHLGIPFGGTKDGYHMPFGLVGSYQIDGRFAINAGAGTPTGAMGLGVWAGFEIFQRLIADRRRIVALEIYEDSGLVFGFAGPDYYARRDNDFVGDAYGYSGTLTFALRLPIGLRACWLRNRFDTYLEGAEILALAPSVESLFEAAAGARIHF